ncbi:MAG: HTH-type transcriptional regulator ChbR [Bacteroidota bacterium]|jgi:AraC-like DNA-binding protein
MTKIQQYKFRAALPYELEVKSLDRLHKANQGLFTKPHRNNFYDVIWFQSGNPVYIVDFQRIEIKPNSLLFINKNQVHFYEAYKDYKGLVMLFTDTFFCLSKEDSQFLNQTILFNDLLNIPYFELEATDATIPNLFLAIQAELKQEPDAIQYRILHHLVHTLLLYAERAYRKKSLKPIEPDADLDIAILFRDWVEKHFTQNKKAHFYAHSLNITEKRLQKSIFQVFGKSPKAYLCDRIILEAKRLLLHSNANTKEIAFELGFDEPTNFIKFFKKYTQKTPIEFRENYFPT